VQFDGFLWNLRLTDGRLGEGGLKVGDGEAGSKATVP